MSVKIGVGILALSFGVSFGAFLVSGSLVYGLLTIINIMSLNSYFGAYGNGR